MSELSRRLGQVILETGPISFFDFMRAALYSEQGGYYSCPLEIGRSGDFYTSVSVGPVFGELLAYRFAGWIQKLPDWGGGFQFVEAGAHDGQLGRDILTALQRINPRLADKIEYWIVEPSPFRRRWQQQALADFPRVRWFETLAELKGRVCGVFFSNELLDAIPVHVFRWRKATCEWVEVGVNVSDDTFTWGVLPAPTTSVPSLCPALLDVLPDGFQIEWSPERDQWWREAAAVMALGKLLTIDYGGTTEELLSPGRNTGTLRAYSKHRLCDDVLANPGERDITSHVNFSELQRIGSEAGLVTEVFETQGEFLGSIAREVWQSNLWQREWSRQFQTLSHPEHLGRSFRVLVQGR